MVDDVDPEQRIAELERRLAQPRAVADPGARHHQLNPTQVHNVSFCKPRLFKRGYDEDEVDALLDFLTIEFNRGSSGRGGGAG